MHEKRLLYLFFMLILEIFLILFSMGAENSGMAGVFGLPESAFSTISTLLFGLFILTLVALLISTQSINKKNYMN